MAIWCMDHGIQPLQLLDCVHKTEKGIINYAAVYIEMGGHMPIPMA